MENEHQKTSNFWTGFAIGALAVGGAAFLLGTKQGRKTLKKILEFSENIEENLLILGEELEEVIEEKGGTIKEDIKKVVSSPTVHSLLDKIKNFTTPNQKQAKKFFVKK